MELYSTRAVFASVFLLLSYTLKVMRRVIAVHFLLIATVFSPGAGAYASGAVSITVFPASIIQGEPMLITVESLDVPVSVKSITFGGVPLRVFTYRARPAALVGMDLNKKPGVYEISVLLSDGRTIKTETTVGERKKIEAPFGIPKKLGGNTQASQDALISTLAAENKNLANLRTGAKTFWKENFVEPLKEIFVTDTYGYVRTTGPYSITHKGVDFRAEEGTPVLSVNRGVVRVARTYRNYGKTVVVDHGLGLMSFYMHLSKIKVNVGELVGVGQVVGLSGQTGYAGKPHLHLSVHIGGVSINPLKFFELFK